MPDLSLASSKREAVGQEHSSVVKVDIKIIFMAQVR